MNSENKNPSRKHLRELENDLDNNDKRTYTDYQIHNVKRNLLSNSGQVI
jgi:hypothetical protein